MYFLMLYNAIILNFSPLFSRNGNIDLLNTLVSSTSDPSQLLYQRNYEGQTCLHIAAEHRQLRVVQFLNHKMDINAQVTNQLLAFVYRIGENRIYYGVVNFVSTFIFPFN